MTEATMKTEKKIIQSDIDIVKDMAAYAVDHFLQKIKVWMERPLVGFYVAEAAQLASDFVSSNLHRDHPLYANILRLLGSLVEKQALLAHDHQRDQIILRAENRINETQRFLHGKEK
jgi:hypothetical protein